MFVSSPENMDPETMTLGLAGGPCGSDRAAV